MIYKPIWVDEKTLKIITNIRINVSEAKMNRMQDLSC